MKNLKPYHVLLLCFLSPVAAGLLRKFWPGQPSYVEVFALGPVMAAAVWAFHQHRRLPSDHKQALLFWAFIHEIYWIVALWADWRIAFAGAVLRLVPLFMATIAFAAIRDQEDLRKISKTICSLALILLPIGIIAVNRGNEILPFWLQPIERLKASSSYYRVGMEVISTIFTTQFTMSWSMVAILFLALTNLSLMKERAHFFWWWSVVLASTLMVFFSTRRAALLVCALGVVFLVLKSQGYIKRRAVFGIILTFVMLFMFDQTSSSGMYTMYNGRSDFFFELPIMRRLNNVFFDGLIFWLDALPFGSGLGMAGPEGSTFNSYIFRIGNPYAVEGEYLGTLETGSALLAAEMGIIGVIMMPCIILWMMYRIHKKARGLQCQKAVNILLFFQLNLFLTYYLKAFLILANIHLALFVFWAVPGICESLIQAEKYGLNDARENSETASLVVSCKSRKPLAAR